ncbi:hypothetical protein [Brachybacterium alimentarium]|uniref:hypothetical protein n=1 Tax=Brachybacterium alimentarium TaxID=47845 RepID=UPI000DF16E37|nr:hypothetical protein [Brachybacterium alimentarium]RCS75939.1 hypothetical protein CIK68_01510 [Brachybacterium alimentarium]RCS80544.1 hypothetical protein CIK70_04910 [Brachybacterium alimentarium]RCS85901.1 hypothetical protein CIK67_07615 [Brachybacterium alimentarium]
MRSRRLVLSAAALGVALAASGCTSFSPVQTHEFYQAGDGTNANIEQAGAVFAGVRDAIVVVEDDGTATFHGSVVSYAKEDVSVELTGMSGGSTLFSASISVPAEGVVDLGADEGQQEIPLSDFPVKPGEVFDLEVSADGQSDTISVPVADTTLSHLGPPPAG